MGSYRSGFSAERPFAPEMYDISRYEQIWKRSPFIVETVAVKASPGLASKYRLVALVASPTDPVAFLVDNREGDPAKNRFMISVKRPDSARHLELVSINVDPDIRKSTVAIRQGTEQATLSFDAETLSKMGAVQPGRAQAVPRRPASGISPVRSRPLPVPVPNPPSSAAPKGANNPAPTPTRRIIRPPVKINGN